MINNILAKIKQKKPLNNLSNEFVETQIEKFLQQNQKLRKSLLGEKLKKKIEEKIIKNVRSELNRIYGQFWIDEKQKLAEEIADAQRREFAAAVNLVDPVTEPATPVPETRDLGWMLYDLDYSEPTDIKPMFFRAKIENGVIIVPPPDSEEVRK